jgi:hypothetical protein
MTIDVPLIHQTKGLNECWLACLQMILWYYNINTSIEQIREEVKTRENIWTYLPQLWCFLLKNEFQVEIITMNPHIFTKTMVNMSQNQILCHLIWLADDITKVNYGEVINWFIQYMKLGWLIKIKIPSINDIRVEISHNRPAVSLYTPNFLAYDQPKFNFHLSVITGIDNENILINDPYPSDKWWRQSYWINDFMYALYASSYWDADNWSIMTIKRL